MEQQKAAGPCLDCEMRCVGCHGKNPDGTWRCKAWGETQEAKPCNEKEAAGEQDYKWFRKDGYRAWQKRTRAHKR